MSTRLFMPLFRQLVVGLKEFAKKSETLRKVLYDSDNQVNFTNLFLHERMLADSIRVNAYRSGIERCVKPGDVVIDLGTGTGLLSFFASQAGARRVYAIDHSRVIEIAREIAAHNGFTNVEFVQKHSNDFIPAEPVDILVHEQMGDDLFCENMVKNLLDLKNRALRPGGRVVPGAFEFFVEPLAIKKEFRVPHIWEFANLGVDVGFLKGSPLVRRHKRPGYSRSIIQTHFADFLLGEPEALITFDINTLVSPADIGQRFKVSRTVIREGELDGFCVYFRAKFDAVTIIDTSPMKPQTSWGNVVFRTERRHCRVGEWIDYTVELPSLTDRTSWKVTPNSTGQ